MPGRGFKHSPGGGGPRWRRGQGCAPSEGSRGGSFLFSSSFRVQPSWVSPGLWSHPPVAALPSHDAFPLYVCVQRPLLYGQQALSQGPPCSSMTSS